MFLVKLCFYGLYELLLDPQNQSSSWGQPSHDLNFFLLEKTLTTSNFFFNV